MVNSGIWIRFRHGVKTTTTTATTVKTTVIDHPTTTRNLEAHQQLQQPPATTLYLYSNFARIATKSLKAKDTI